MHLKGTMRAVLVFVDDAGDTGFKFENNPSRHFLVTSVIFEDEDGAQKAGSYTAPLYDPKPEG